MAQKVWNLYTNQGGSLNDGTIWFLQNGSTPGGTAGVPGPFDYVYFVNYGTTNENFTGTLGAQTIEVDAGPPLVLNGGAIGSSDLFIYTGSTLTLNGATATQTDGTNAINLYGGTLNLVGGTVNALGIYEGVMSGGSLIATSNSHLNFSGAPNGVPNAGLVGLSVKRSALIDNSTVTSPLGLIGIGDADPAANATMTVQNNSQVTALYTYIGSGNSTSGSLNILGSGTTYANVGPPSTLNSSGYTVVGGVSSVDPLTIPRARQPRCMSGPAPS